LPKPEDVPAVQYDDIYDKYPVEFDKIDGFGKPESIYLVTDAKERKEKVYKLRFNDGGTLTDFGQAEIRRNAYKRYVPDKYIERYVDYYSLLAEGIPDDWPTDSKGNKLTWYQDDWYLIEHPAFYEDIYVGELELFDYLNEKDKNGIVYKDRVPSITVWNKYVEYLDLVEGKPREDFRWENRDLDEWLLLTGKITVSIQEKRRRAKLSPQERVREELAEIERKLKEK